MVPAVLPVFTKVCDSISPVPLATKPEMFDEAVAVHCAVAPGMLKVNATAILLLCEQTVCDKEVLVIAAVGFTVMV